MVRCFQGCPVKRQVLAPVIGAVMCIGLLSGCNGTSGGVIGQAKTVSQNDIPAVPNDPKPTAEGTESVAPGGPGFVDDAKGAPVVKRDDEKPAGAKAAAAA